MSYSTNLYWGNVMDQVNKINLTPYWSAEFDGRYVTILGGGVASISIRADDVRAFANYFEGVAGHYFNLRDGHGNLTGDQVDTYDKACALANRRYDNEIQAAVKDPDVFPDECSTCYGENTDDWYIVAQSGSDDEILYESKIVVTTTVEKD